MIHKAVQEEANTRNIRRQQYFHLNIQKQNNKEYCVKA